MSILIIDDEPELQTLLETLAAEGFDSRVANYGREWIMLTVGSVNFESTEAAWVASAEGDFWHLETRTISAAE